MSKWGALAWQTCWLAWSLLKPAVCSSTLDCIGRAVASLAEDPRFHLALTLQPGDLEIIHNPTIFHARGDINDGEVRQGHIIAPSVLWAQQLAFSLRSSCAAIAPVHVWTWSCIGMTTGSKLQANDEKRHLLRWWVHTYDNPRPVR